ncbi:MAG TPA: hypothetical protein PK359_15025 [Burkholderiaceae bacterium]|nr:hypothetical protein [Burkholderiaceae bacterium]
MLDKLQRLILSPSNWLGLALASAVLVLKGLGMLGWAAGPLALAGYGVGFVAGGLLFGFPSFAGSAWESLSFADEGDARESMGRALSSVRRLVEDNPGGRLPRPLQQQVLALCSSLDGLLAQWERSKGALSLQEGFHARHIALSYLPDALKTFLSIPPQFAATRVLRDGKTAQDLFRETLTDLESKVRELGDDLASQDAHAFLAHSQFLHEKFGPRDVLIAPDLSSTKSSQQRGS